jgi:hypothetical protein
MTDIDLQSGGNFGVMSAIPGGKAYGYQLRPKGEGQGITATLHGDLAQILALCADSGREQKLPKDGTSGSQLSVVAGTRNQRYLHLDHAIL